MDFRVKSLCCESTLNFNLSFHELLLGLTSSLLPHFVYLTLANEEAGDDDESVSLDLIQLLLHLASEHLG